MLQYHIALGVIQTNCYIIVDETSGNAAVIDPGDCTPELVELLKNPNIKSVESILLTHGHFDHILGAVKLKKFTGAKIFIHKRDAECLENDNRSMAYHLGIDVQEYIEPDVVLDDNTIINLGDIKIKTIHTPGHTPGSVCFLCELQKVIFTGDTLFKLDVGRTDFPGGNSDELQKSLYKLSALAGDYDLFPGHNSPTTLNYERLNNRYMRMPG